MSKSKMRAIDAIDFALRASNIEWQRHNIDVGLFVRRLAEQGYCIAHFEEVMLR